MTGKELEDECDRIVALLVSGEKAAAISAFVDLMRGDLPTPPIPDNEEGSREKQ